MCPKYYPSEQASAEQCIKCLLNPHPRSQLRLDLLWETSEIERALRMRPQAVSNLHTLLVMMEERQRDNDAEYFVIHEQVAHLEAAMGHYKESKKRFTIALEGYQKIGGQEDRVAEVRTSLKTLEQQKHKFVDGGIPGATITRS